MSRPPPSGDEVDPAVDHVIDPTHRVLPDGCIDIVWRPDQGLVVAGPSTTAFLAELMPGTTASGIRLRPGAAPPVLGVTAPSLLDATVPASSLWGDDARRLEAHLAVTSGATSTTDPVGIVTEWLRRRLRGAPLPDSLAIHVVRSLGGNPCPRLDVIAEDVGVGERQLRRRVTAAVGYGPKRLARVLRMQRALALRSARPALGWAGVAHAAGYADQPHLIQDVGALTGVTPTALDARLLP